MLKLLSYTNEEKNREHLILYVRVNDILNLKPYE